METPTISLNSLFKFDNFTELDGTNGELFVLTQEPTLEDFQATWEANAITGDYNRVSGEVILKPSQRLIELADELHSLGMEKYDFSREKYYESIGDVAFQGLRTKEAKAKKVLAYYESELGQKHLTNKIEKNREVFKRSFLHTIHRFINDRYTNCVTDYFTKHTKSILSVDTDLQKLESEIKELQDLIDRKEQERKAMYNAKANAHPFVQQLHPLLSETQIKSVTNTSYVITRGFFG
jgi:hypothetical protein